MKRSIPSGSQVSFTIGDAVCPDAMEAVQHAGPELAVTGEVLYFSDGNGRKREFAVVHVNGIESLLVVPADRLREPMVNFDSDEVGRGEYHTPREPAFLSSPLTKPSSKQTNDVNNPV